jgi:hypothetical protein
VRNNEIMSLCIYIFIIPVMFKKYWHVI